MVKQATDKERNMEISGTVAKVSAGYSLKVPAAADYSSEDAHVSFGIEFDISGAEDLDTIVSQLEALEAQLHASAKLAVFAQLGTEFEAGPNGVMVPVIKSAPKAAAPAARRPSGGGGGGGGTGRGGFAKPKAQGRELPVVVLGGEAYYDQRVLKEDGTYKDGAADFKSVQKVNGQANQLWITGRDGSFNDDVVALLDEAGIAY
jgi:hypothetical protein